MGQGRGPPRQRRRAGDGGLVASWIGTHPAGEKTVGGAVCAVVAGAMLVTGERGLPLTATHKTLATLATEVRDSVGKGAPAVAHDCLEDLADAIRAIHGDVLIAKDGNEARRTTIFATVAFFVPAMGTWKP